jgi:hypothetical protein
MEEDMEILLNPDLMEEDLTSPLKGLRTSREQE